MFDFEAHFVGGCVRDNLLGLESDDIDFVVTLPEPVSDPVRHLETMLTEQRFEVFKVSTDTLTVRAKVPAHLLGSLPTNTVDFSVCREESSASDGRRPDEVIPVFGPEALVKDLSRRDFTINAVARSMSGKIVDPHGGVQDLQSRTLRFVGDAATRIEEDGLRVMRGFRFAITKGLVVDAATWDALVSDTAAKVLASDAVSEDRIHDELNKMMKVDSVGSMKLLVEAFKCNAALEGAIFKKRLHLEASLKKIK